MAEVLSHLVSQLADKVIKGITGGVSHNRYTLTTDALSSPISIFQVESEEQLNQPWHYTITFTSSDKGLTSDLFLNQNATLTFNPVSDVVSAALGLLQAGLSPVKPRTLHGVITAFSQLSVNKEEAHYQVVLSSRLGLLALQHSSAMAKSLLFW